MDNQLKFRETLTVEQFKAAQHVDKIEIKPMARKYPDGTLMKDAVSRNTYVEHPTAMIIAAVMLTILNKKFKTNDTLKMSWVILGFVAIALMLWAFQWSRLFGA